MALKDGYRIWETTTTTGAGTISLDGATTGFTTFLSEIGNGNTCFYHLTDANGTAWEAGIGTVTSGTPNTLARTTVLRSSNANAAINLTAGTHSVINAPIYGYATGEVNFQGQTLNKPLLKNYIETIATPAISSGTLTLDLSTANVFNVTHNANITTLTINNAPASGISESFVLHLTQDSNGGRTLIFPASVKWASGTAATISTTASKRNKFVFDTKDGGTTWDCVLVGKDYA